MYAALHEKKTLRTFNVIEGHWTTTYEQLHFIYYLYIALDWFSIVNINLAGNMVWLICNKMQKQNTKHISEKKQFQDGSICIHKIDEHACTTNKYFFTDNHAQSKIKALVNIIAKLKCQLASK